MQTHEMRARVGCQVACSTYLGNRLASSGDQKVCFVDPLKLLIAEVIFEANGSLARSRDVSRGGCGRQPPSNEAKRSSQGLQHPGASN